MTPELGALVLLGLLCLIVVGVWMIVTVTRLRWQHTIATSRLDVLAARGNLKELIDVIQSDARVVRVVRELRTRHDDTFASEIVVRRRDSLWRTRHDDKAPSVAEPCH